MDGIFENLTTTAMVMSLIFLGLREVLNFMGKKKENEVGRAIEVLNETMHRQNDVLEQLVELVRELARGGSGGDYGKRR